MSHLALLQEVFTIAKLIFCDLLMFFVTFFVLIIDDLSSVLLKKNDRE